MLIEITREPTPQTIALGKNATFHCDAVGGNFHWRITFESSVRKIMEYEYKLPGYGIRSEGSAVFNYTAYQYHYTSSLIIFGTEENNNTEVYCEVVQSQTRTVSNTVGLLVFGTFLELIFLLF